VVSQREGEKRIASSLMAAISRGKAAETAADRAAGMATAAFEAATSVTAAVSDLVERVGRLEDSMQLRAAEGIA